VNTEDDPANDELTPDPDLPEGQDEMIDEDAIEQFGRDLDDADLAARAFTEGERDERDDPGEGDAALTAVPPVPADSF